MVNERFLIDVLRFPVDIVYDLRENSLCEILFTIKATRYMGLARDIISIDEVTTMGDLLRARTSTHYQTVLDRRFLELDADK